LAAAAQQIDVAAAQKRFQDLYAAGNYSAALAEAQKAEAAAKRGGTNNFAYVSALNDLARAHQALGRYGEAASMFKQVVGTLQRNLPPTDIRVAQPLANPGHGVSAAGHPPTPSGCTSKRSTSRPRRRASNPPSPCSRAISATSTEPGATIGRGAVQARARHRGRPAAEQPPGGLILNNLTRSTDQAVRRGGGRGRRALAIREKALGEPSRRGRDPQQPGAPVRATRPLRRGRRVVPALDRIWERRWA
jgi:tetratricopeptide (TPR) repeat protein